MIAISSPTLQVCLNATLSALLASVLAGPAAATQPRRAPDGTPRISITNTQVAPNVVRTAGAHAFVLLNDSTGIVRVEFTLRRGDGIACSARGRTPRLMREFVLGRNETLVCHAKPGEYEFAAYRIVRVAGGDLRLSLSRGKILVS